MINNSRLFNFLSKRCSPCAFLFQFILLLGDASSYLLALALLSFQNLSQLGNFVLELLHLVAMISLEIAYGQLLLLHLKPFLGHCLLLLADRLRHFLALLLFVVNVSKDLIQFLNKVWFQRYLKIYLLDVKLGFTDLANATSDVGFAKFLRELKVLEGTITAGPFLAEVTSINLGFFASSTCASDEIFATAEARWKLSGCHLLQFFLEGC